MGPNGQDDLSDHCNRNSISTIDKTRYVVHDPKFMCNNDSAETSKACRACYDLATGPGGVRMPFLSSEGKDCPASDFLDMSTPLCVESKCDRNVKTTTFVAIVSRDVWTPMVRLGGIGSQLSVH